MIDFYCGVNFINFSVFDELLKIYYRKINNAVLTVRLLINTGKLIAGRYPTTSVQPHSGINTQKFCGLILLPSLTNSV